MKRFAELWAILQGDRRIWPLILASLALALALAHFTVSVRRDAFRYIIVVDVTQSMYAQDYRMNGQPTGRLAFVKQALHQVLPELPCGSEVGLAIFSEHRSFLLFAPVEVCANLRDITPTLDRLDWRMASVGNSEIAKGLYEGLRNARRLQPQPGLVFITDGQEAPPVNPRYRPVYDGTPGEVKGVIIGAGGLMPMPIPKFDLSGRFIGYWAANEVPQTDPYSEGRRGSTQGERMVEGGGVRVPEVKAAGNEHLSSLREPYLQQLAQETGLHYRRLVMVEDMRAALHLPDLAHRRRAEASLSWGFGLLALGCLMAVYTVRR